MESYSVSIKASAAKELEALPTLKDRQRATAIVRGLAANPRPQGSLKLAGTTDAYRIRFGSYRILYTVSDRVRVVSASRSHTAARLTGSFRARPNPGVQRTRFARR